MTKSRNLLDLMLILVAAATVAWIYQQADGFYDLPRSSRVDHPKYESFRPGGFIGKLIGSLAVVLFAFNLLYLPRRRMRVLHRVSDLRRCMSAHVFFGLLGGGLVALHSAFRMTSEVARWSAWAVIVLIATGIIGRYIYALVPHTATGEEEPDGLAGRVEQALAMLTSELGEGHPFIADVRRYSHIDVPPERNLILAFFKLFIVMPARVVGRVQVAFAVRRAQATGTPISRTLHRTANSAVGLGVSYAVAGAAARVLRGWRSIHLMAAMIMVAASAVHIFNAYEKGYAWEIPERWALWTAAILALPALVVVLEIRQRSRRKRRVVRVFATDGPPPEPPMTLHPYVDPSICMASGACVSSCPEGDILDLLDGRARLVDPDHCIGHGECATNCPVGAITLVYGTSTRGVDIPDVTRDFESNVPGIYLVGEITGMGLIHNAVKQGNHAVDHLVKQARKDPKHTDSDPHSDRRVDVCIIGAGPAGMAATLACVEAQLSTVTIEQEHAIGGAINHYPRRKVVMLGPMDFRGYKKIKLPEVLKEELVEIWQDLEKHTAINVTFGVKVTGIQRRQHGFDVHGVPVGIQPGAPGFEERRFSARRVLIAVGRRGTPRKLQIPGEAQPHVVYAVSDPDQHAGRTVLVVGGGDSALEAAVACAEAGASEVHLVYRRRTFDRAKAANRTKLNEAVAEGSVTLHLDRNPTEIKPDTVLLDSGELLRADDVVICVGGTLPTGLLKAAGCHVTQHFGRPLA